MVVEGDSEGADFGIGVLGAAKEEKVTPGAGVCGDDDFGFGGVRQDATSGLASGFEREGVGVWVGGK